MHLVQVRGASVVLAKMSQGSLRIMMTAEEWKYGSALSECFKMIFRRPSVRPG